MLIRERDGQRLAITQPVHAWVSAQLARLWGNEEFGGFEPREEVILGAALHDIGWLEWERHPTLNTSTGLPHTFMQLPTSSHLAVWGSASTLARPFGRYASLLVSMHGTGLYAFHDYSRDTEQEASAARAYVERELDFQHSTIRELTADPCTAFAVTPENIARNRRLVAVWDAMSLAICGGLTSTRHVRDVPSSGEPIDMIMTPLDAHVRVDPWPFAVESLTVRFEGRNLGERFATERDLRQSLADSSWVTVEVLVIQA